MANIIGVKKTSFLPKDSDKQIDGLTIYITEPFARDRGEGCEAEKMFLSSAKVSSLDFTPAVGQDVEVRYNKWGKVETLTLKDDEWR